MTSVLVVDDDGPLRRSLSRALTYEGYEVRDAADGAVAVHSVRERTPDAIVLDIMLPGLDGLEACRQIRLTSKVPILMLTARHSTDDLIRGLDSGADDYLRKPFALEELLARLRALLRRQPVDAEQHTFRYADLSLNERRHEVRRGSRPIHLSSREWELLRYLLTRPEEVVNRSHLLSAVWRYPESSNVLEVYIGYLRAKLEAGGEVRLIHTVRGVGYVLRVPLG